MDLWALYLPAKRVKVPAADKRIAFDRLVISDIGKAADGVPKPLHRDLMASDDETLRYLWQYGCPASDRQFGTAVGLETT